MLAPDGFGLLSIEEADPKVLIDFDCGKERLNSFLHEAAADWHGRRLGFTTLVFHETQDHLVGYFTLAHDAIQLKDSERLEVEAQSADVTSFPAVKLGRLAVSKKHQGIGVGGQILRLAIGEIVSGANLSASRLMVVDADNDGRVIHFYEQLGFRLSLWAETRANNHTKRREAASSTKKMWIDLLAIPPNLN